MRELQPITQYQNLTQKLLYQYQDSEKLKALLDGIHANANSLDAALFEIRDEFYLFNAIGKQLDTIGIIFNVARMGRFDELYRQAIQEKAVLQYSGEPESIIELMLSVYGATSVQYRPGYPGKYYLFADVEGVLSSDLAIINPAGVLALFEKPIVDGAMNFIVDAQGRKICAVIEITYNFIVDALGNSIVDALGRSIVELSL